MHKFYKFLLSLAFLFFLHKSALSQTGVNQEKAAYYFNQGLHALTTGDSLSAFQQLQQAYTFSNKEDNITYYYLSLALHLNKPFAEAASVQWLKQTNNVIFQSRLNYFLGEYYFRNHQDKAAIEAYVKLPIEDLNNEEIINFKFHLGYLYFKEGNWDKASTLLNSLRQIKTGKFFYDANYYAGFMALKNKDFKVALSCFELAAQSEEYSNLVPFYIGQLYYFLGDIQKAISFSTQAIESKDQFYDSEIRQLLGHLWFDKKEYEKALPLLEAFVSKQTKVQSQDLYQLSFCYFQTKQWVNAIDGFKQLTNGNDSLAQNSMYLLATSYLKIDNKIGARNAFLFCSTKSQNLVQKEISLFNYGKLCVELKDYAQAVQTLDQFRELYPTSIYLSECTQLWVKSLALTNNYVQALEVYQTIENPNEELQKLYPSILFGRSVVYLNDGQIDKAHSSLKTIVTLPFNELVLPPTYFWIGELSYKLGLLQESVTAIENYLLAPVNEGEITIQHARYTLGYNYIKKGEYQNALTNFNVAAALNPMNAVNGYQKDAFVRTADCMMMLKQYKLALQVYQKVIDLHWTYQDYATLQKASLLGGMGKTNEKIDLLKQFDKVYPVSTYLNDARMELAETYIYKEDFQSALSPLNAILLDKNAISFYPIALYKIGVTYFNMNKNEAALQNFVELNKSYPNSVETENSLELVRSIFLEDQKPESFVNYMNAIGRPLALNEQDSLTYRSAMMRYEEKNYQDAKLGLIKYLQLFPSGMNQLASNYLLAEMYYANQTYDSAAFYFSKVADQSPNRYGERAILLTARLYYFNLKNYDLAEKYFLQLKSVAVQKENILEALRGILRCQYKNNKWTEAAPIAQQIMEDKSFASDDILMANMVLYHDKLIKGDTTTAISTLGTIISNNSSIYTAEAHYQLALIYFNQKKYTQAEKTAFDVVKKQSSYEFWVTSAYILLGDIYVAQKDWFNALATYKSVAENATVISLKEDAAEKLKLAQAAEKLNNKVDN